MIQRKVLFISDHGDPLAPLGSKQAGGQNNYVHHLALSLEEEGYSVDVVTHWCLDEAPQIESFGKSSRVIRIAAGKKGFVDKNELFTLLPRFYIEMKNTIDLSEYELLHTHYWLSGVLGLQIKKEFGLPWFHTNHSLGIAKQLGTGMKDKRRLYYEERILTEVDQIIATTPNEKKLILDTVASPAPVHIVPIGVADTYHRLYKKPYEFGNYFLFVGRLEESKGIYVLLNSFRELVEQKKIPKQIKLLIAGGSETDVNVKKFYPNNPKLQQAIVGLEDRIKFLGPKNENELAELFKNAVATVVPSYYESFGMVAAEAQACGCPVIASKVGGLQDIVIPYKTGLHVAKGNISKLAESMYDLLRKPQLLKELKTNARKFAGREFKWQNIAKKIDNLYEESLYETIR
ncbi:glycosyltransferase [Lysinibacillus yapensis]|uniref:Glycosyltransferase n=1 Tax=Ureibacillus yapensis TaxID=2304605 RepID=A0A396S7N2_9BACL|nr:glycosyltransferase [Lysinibacillus yapensis]RHW33456.1 glycosyltransferase [Lysinibacillus yapensis]